VAVDWENQRGSAQTFGKPALTDVPAHCVLMRADWQGMRWSLACLFRDDVQSAVEVRRELISAHDCVNRGRCAILGSPGFG
jgi:hypothetical protein